MSRHLDLHPQADPMQTLLWEPAGMPLQGGACREAAAKLSELKALVLAQLREGHTHRDHPDAGRLLSWFQEEAAKQTAG